MKKNYDKVAANVTLLNCMAAAAKRRKRISCAKLAKKCGVASDRLQYAIRAGMFIPDGRGYYISIKECYDANDALAVMRSAKKAKHNRYAAKKNIASKPGPQPQRQWAPSLRKPLTADEVRIFLRKMQEDGYTIDEHGRVILVVGGI